MIKTLETITHDFGGDIFIDVGGNVGQWTMELIGLYKKIYLIEPSSEAITQAKENISGHCDFFNQPDLKYKVEYIKKICTDNSNGSMTIGTSTADTGNFSVFAFDLYGNENIEMIEHNIPTMKLDDLLLSIPDNSKITIKIDTEGCELSVLLGAKELIKKHKPVMCVEFHYHMNYDDNKHKEFDQLLAEVGYKIIQNPFACYVYEEDRLWDHRHTGRDLQNLHFQSLYLPLYPD